MNTTEFLNITSLIVPHRPCVIFEGKRFSFGEVADRAARDEAGIGHGAILLPPCDAITHRSHPLHHRRLRKGRC